MLLGAFVSSNTVDRHEDKTPREEIEDASKDKNNEGAAHNDHVVWHAEIGGSDIDEEGMRVHPTRLRRT